MNYIIYKVINTVNNKAYIGQTSKCFSVRWTQHCKAKTALGAAIKKYGKHCFIFETLHTDLSLVEANRIEQLEIASLNTQYPNGYNVHPGGDNHAWSAEMKQKFSESRKGKGNPKYGKFGSFHTVESKEKLRQFRLVKPNLTKAAKVICVNNGKQYDSMTQAAKELNLSPAKISLVCSGHRKHTKGFSFRKASA